MSWLLELVSHLVYGGACVLLGYAFARMREAKRLADEAEGDLLATMRRLRFAPWWMANGGDKPPVPQPSDPDYDADP